MWSLGHYTWSVGQDDSEKEEKEEALIPCLFFSKSFFLTVTSEMTVFW